MGQLADNLYIRQYHHVPLPAGISATDANEIIALGNQGIIDKFKSHRVTDAMGDGFLNSVNHYFKQAMTQKTNLHYVLFVGHDGSILSVMNALGVPLNQMPGFAARLNFSLYENNHHYYIKTTLNNQSVTLPGCDGKLCSETQFNALIH
jgi:acid phosphatase